MNDRRWWIGMTAGLLICLVAGPALADDWDDADPDVHTQADAPRSRAGHRDDAPRYADFNLNITLLLLEDAAADAVGVDPEVWEVAFEAGFRLWFIPRVGEYFSLGLGGGGLFFHDRQPFSVEVENDEGETRQAESSATGWSLYPYARLEVPLARYFSATGTIGYKHLFAERSVRNCVNCPSERIRVRGGGFVGGGIAVGDRAKLRFEYHVFLNGDVKSQFILGFGVTY